MSLWSRLLPLNYSTNKGDTRSGIFNLDFIFRRGQIRQRVSGVLMQCVIPFPDRGCLGQPSLFPDTNDKVSPRSGHFVSQHVLCILFKPVSMLSMYRILLAVSIAIASWQLPMLVKVLYGYLYSILSHFYSSPVSGWGGWCSVKVLLFIWTLCSASTLSLIFCLQNSKSAVYFLFVYFAQGLCSLCISAPFLCKEKGSCSLCFCLLSGKCVRWGVGERMGERRFGNSLDVISSWQFLGVFVSKYIRSM